MYKRTIHKNNEQEKTNNLYGNSGVLISRWFQETVQFVKHDFAHFPEKKSRYAADTLV